MGVISFKKRTVRPTFRAQVIFVSVFFSVFLNGIAFDGTSKRLCGTSKVFADTLSSVSALIESNYLQELSPEVLEEGAMRGMLQALDPHSTYLSPEQYKRFVEDTQGKYAGIGVEISVKDGWMIILKVIAGGPAEKAGMEPGDKILQIENVSARDLPLDRATQLIRGAEGTKVRIAVRRMYENGTLFFDVQRAIVELMPVTAKLLFSNILYVRAEIFQDGLTEQLLQLLKTFSLDKKKKLQGMLLDLRNNPGGLLREAVSFTNLFLKKGLIVSTKSRNRKTPSQVFANVKGTLPDFPVVILVNAFTASAAEIVSGALQDHGRALVVGEQTFGKGSVQSIFPLNNGGAVKLTVAKYYTPSGRSIQALGIAPDVFISAETLSETPLSKDSKPFSGEAKLEGHLRNDRVVVDLKESQVTRENYRDVNEVVAREQVPFSNDAQAQMAYEILSGLVRLQR